MPALKYRIIGGLAALSLVLAACGGHDDTGKQLRQQGAALSAEGAGMQQFAAREQADVQAGRKTQAQADQEIQAKTDALLKHATAVEDTAIDTAKKQNGVPSDVQKQLDQAKQQLDATTK